MYVSNPLIWLVGQIVSIYSLVVLIYLVTRILIQFGVVNGYNPVVKFINDTGAALVEPALAPIRKYVPPFGNLDLSPLILLIGLQFAFRVFVWLFANLGLV